MRRSFFSFMLLIFLILPFPFVSCAQNSDSSWIRTVYKEDGEDFTILNLTDIQFGSTMFLLDFEKNADMIDRLIQEVKPDLITITGDFSYGCELAFYGICSFINSYGIPWAPVFGNHDFGFSDISPLTEAEIFESYSNCLFRKGPPALAFDSETGFEAYGNYVVNISNGSEIIRSLIFMNSMQDGIVNSQMEWYRDFVQSLDSGTPSSVFLHIPVHGFYLANNAAINNGNITVARSYSTSTDIWNEGYESSFGVAYSVYGPYKPDGFDTLMNELSSTDLIVCGHEHYNCTCIEYKGITYLFSLKTGSGCFYDRSMCGGSEIKIHDDGSFSVRHVFGFLEP